MKMHSIRIKNFRIFNDVYIEFGDYSAFVGENGAGKSTVLAALNVFFRETTDSKISTTVLTNEDFHNKNTKEPVEITVTFNDLSDEAVQDFQSYVRQGQLTITASAEFDDATERAMVKQLGERLVMSAFTPFFEADKAKEKVADLRIIFDQLRSQFPELPDVSIKAEMKQALRDFEEKHSDLCSLERSEDNFYGFTKGTDKLKKYLNWVYIPAVKDVSSEALESRNSALGELVRVTVRSKLNFDQEINDIRDKAREDYHLLLEQHQSALDDISASISSRLATLAHPSAKAELKWTEDEDRSVVVNDPMAKIVAGESDFSGDIARFGHGFQRCYLVALLQELAETGLSEIPNLILGMEEPELYQHPPQARHLAGVLQTLSTKKAQILVTTHSPLFVSGYHFEDVYVVRRDPAETCSTVDSLTFKQVADEISFATGKDAVPAAAEQALLQQALSPQLNEMFFCGKIVFVEGIEDEAILKAWLILTKAWDTMREQRAHIIPVHNKSNLLRPATIAKLLGLPFVVIFDADGNEQSPGKRAMHEEDNLAMLKLLGQTELPAFPDETVFEEKFIMWSTNLQTQLKSEVEQAEWDRAFQAAKQALGNPGKGYKKNPVLLGELISNLYKNRVVPSCLEQSSAILINKPKPTNGE